MTFICLVLGCALIAYGFASCFDFIPVVGKEDSDREQRIPITTKERSVMISEIVDVKIPGGDHPENKTIEEEVEIVTPMFTYYDVPLSDEIQQYIHIQCLEKFGTIELDGYNLPKLVMNIIRWESGFDQDNDNGKCCGLMSVTHNLWKGIEISEQITNLIDPAQNIRAGMHILYNAFDESFCDQNKPPFNETYCNSDEFQKVLAGALNYYHTGFANDSETDYVKNILYTYDNTNERS